MFANCWLDPWKQIAKKFEWKYMNVKLWAANWLPFSLGLNVLKAENFFSEFIFMYLYSELNTYEDQGPIPETIRLLLTKRLVNYFLPTCDFSIQLDSMNDPASIGSQSQQSSPLHGSMLDQKLVSYFLYCISLFMISVCGKRSVHQDHRLESEPITSSLFLELNLG